MEENFKIDGGFQIMYKTAKKHYLFFTEKMDKGLRLAQIFFRAIYLSWIMITSFLCMNVLQIQKYWVFTLEKFLVLISILFLLILLDFFIPNLIRKYLEKKVWKEIKETLIFSIDHSLSSIKQDLVNYKKNKQDTLSELFRTHKECPPTHEEEMMLKREILGLSNEISRVEKVHMFFEEIYEKYGKGNTIDHFLKKQMKRY